MTTFVLAGHSYGGTVITGVADRAPDRVRALVYLDAFVPNDEQRRWYIDGAGATGVGVEPLPFFDPAWTVHDWPTRHNVMREGPHRVLDLLTSR